MSSEKTVTNIAIRSAYDSIALVLGEKGRDIIFRNAHLYSVLENPPDYTWDRNYSNDEQANIYREVIDLVGKVGAQGILRRMGYGNVETAVIKYKVLDSIKDLPPEEKIKKCFEFSQTILNKGRVLVDDKGLPALDVFDCLTCSDVKSSKPYCAQYAGGLQFMADWTFGRGKYHVIEEKCFAIGNDTCLFALKPR